MTAQSPYDTNLDKNPANFAPLTPLVFLDWAADVYPDRLAVVHGSRRYSWAQTAGTAVTLSSTSSAQPTFTAPETPGSLKFTVTVMITGVRPVEGPDLHDHRRGRVARHHASRRALG